MHRVTIVQYIRSTIDIPEAEAIHIADQFEYRALQKGGTFLKEGKISNEYLFLETGYMRAFLYDTEGNDVTVGFYSPSNVVIEVASFFQRTPAQENMIALTDCEGWVITFDQLNFLFHNIPFFREFGRAILVKGFVSLKIRMLSMINQTAEERYRRLLESNPTIFQHAPLKTIASYLGVTDTSLSRIRKEFSKK